LKSGGTLDADLVVAGVGVRPRLALAEKAGLAIDRGVVVDSYLETSAPGSLRPETLRAGPICTAARTSAWSIGSSPSARARPPRSTCSGIASLSPRCRSSGGQHYDVPINYVGHAEKWDDLTIDGDIASRDCLLSYRRNGRVLAAASIYRDVESLQAEVMMERSDREIMATAGSVA